MAFPGTMAPYGSPVGSFPAGLTHAMSAPYGSTAYGQTLDLPAGTVVTDQLGRRMSLQLPARAVSVGGKENKSHQGKGKNKSQHGKGKNKSQHGKHKSHGKQNSQQGWGKNKKSHQNKNKSHQKHKQHKW